MGLSCHLDEKTTTHIFIDRQVMGDSTLAQVATSEDLRDDYEGVLAAVQQNGLALEFASAELQDDTDAVLAAVRQSGLALQWASDDLQGDLDVVISAVSQDGVVLLWLSDELRGNAEVRRAVEGGHYILEHVDVR